jgi:hypothetical protein
MGEKIHAVGPVSETNSLAWDEREGNIAAEKTWGTVEIKEKKGGGPGAEC